MGKQSKTKNTNYGSTEKVTRASSADSGAESASAPTVSVAEPQVKPTRKRKSEPTIAQIQARAYEIYLARAGRPGSAESDWLQAERELRG